MSSTDVVAHDPSVGAGRRHLPALRAGRNMIAVDDHAFQVPSTALMFLPGEAGEVPRRGGGVMSNATAASGLSVGAGR
jgi:hypothetical protein